MPPMPRGVRGAGRSRRHRRRSAGTRSSSSGAVRRSASSRSRCRGRARCGEFPLIAENNGSHEREALSAADPVFAIAHAHVHVQAADLVVGDDAGHVPHDAQIPSWSVMVGNGRASGGTPTLAATTPSRAASVGELAAEPDEHVLRSLERREHGRRVLHLRGEELPVRHRRPVGRGREATRTPRRRHPPAAAYRDRGRRTPPRCRTSSSSLPSPQCPLLELCGTRRTCQPLLPHARNCRTRIERTRREIATSLDILMGARFGLPRSKERFR